MATSKKMTSLADIPSWAPHLFCVALSYTLVPTSLIDSVVSALPPHTPYFLLELGIPEPVVEFLVGNGSALFLLCASIAVLSVPLGIAEFQARIETDRLARQQRQREAAIADHNNASILKRSWRAFVGHSIPPCVQKELTANLSYRQKLNRSIQQTMIAGAALLFIMLVIDACIFSPVSFLQEIWLQWKNKLIMFGVRLALAALCGRILDVFQLNLFDVNRPETKDPEKREGTVKTKDRNLVRKKARPEKPKSKYDKEAKSPIQDRTTRSREQRDYVCGKPNKIETLGRQKNFYVEDAKLPLSGASSLDPPPPNQEDNARPRRAVAQVSQKGEGRSSTRSSLTTKEKTQQGKNESTSGTVYYDTVEPKVVQERSTENSDWWWNALATVGVAVGGILMVASSINDDNDDSRRDHDHLKIAYTDRYEAERVANRMKRQKVPGHEKLNTYQNHTTSNWHVGRKK